MAAAPVEPAAARNDRRPMEKILLFIDRSPSLIARLAGDEARRSNQSAIEVSERARLVEALFHVLELARVGEVRVEAHQVHGELRGRRIGDALANTHPVELRGERRGAREVALEI